MTLLEIVAAARADLEAHRKHSPTPAPDQPFMEWWAVRRALINALLAAESAAIDAGLLETFTADF